MSNKITINFKDQKLDFQEFNGSIIVQRTMVATDWRGQKTNFPTETLFALSYEEARYLADAFNTVIGRGEPLKPVEKVTAPAEAVAVEKVETVSASESAAEKA
jgi:hypothetical protein